VTPFPSGKGTRVKYGGPTKTEYIQPRPTVRPSARGAAPTPGEPPIPPVKGGEAPTKGEEVPVKTEETVKVPAGEKMEDINEMEMNRLLRGQMRAGTIEPYKGANANLPKSPPGKGKESDPAPYISAAAKENFNLDSASDLKLKQMYALYKFWKRNEGKLPMKGDLTEEYFK
jgi:hypothetical protein